MEIIDITRPIEQGGLVYPGDPPIRFEMAGGRPSAISIPCHCLTHLDAPFHFIADGIKVNDIAPGRLILPARVIEVAGDSIGLGDLPMAEEMKGQALLFRTRHSARRDPPAYDEHHVYVTAECAQAIAAAEAALVGIDYLSLDDHADRTFPAHRILLGAGVPILEGLDLSQAVTGDYTLIALPLKLAQADGAPVRAVLVSRSGDLSR